MKRLLFLFAPLCSLSAATGTVPVDLGANLSYLRVHSLAGSAPGLGSVLSAGRALVLDLRYPTANEESLAMLRTALASHPQTAPLFVLISPSTPATVIEVVNQTPGAFISLGAANSPSARIEVKTDAVTDRRAYDAFDAGTPMDTLISGKIEKERFDEATLVQEFKNGNYDAEPPALPDPTAIKPENPAEPSPATTEAGRPGRLIDRVLQRAVQLHQTLLALRQPAG